MGDCGGSLADVTKDEDVFGGIDASVAGVPPIKSEVECKSLLCE